MEILALKLSITDGDLNTLAKQYAPRDSPVRNFRVHITPDGVSVSGDYQIPMLLAVPFTTRWELSVQSRTLVVKLASVKVVGVAAGMFRGTILRGFEKIAEREQGVRIENDALFFDVDTIVRTRGLPIQTNLSRVTCKVGELLLEV